MNREDFRDAIRDSMPNPNLLSGIRLEGNKAMVTANYGGIVKQVAGAVIHSVEVKNGRAKVVYKATDPVEDTDSEDSSESTTEDENMTEDNTTTEDTAEDSKPEETTEEEEE